MKKLEKIIYSAILAILTIGFTTCEDYLDVSTELAENLTTEEIFNNIDYTKRWQANVFNCIPDYSEKGKAATTGFTAIWDIMAGQTSANTTAIGTQMITGFNSSSASFHRWATLYRCIRQGLIFLDNAKESMGISGDTKYISVEEMNRMKAETKYFIAYSYFLLFELYGPVPIVYKAEDPENKDIDYARAPVDELVGYIDELLKEIIDSNALPETLFTGNAENSPDYEHSNDRYNLKEIVRPTKVTALALRARLWVYAASPLFNGKYAEALKVTNKDGVRLFPDEDKSKWNTAKQHLEALLTFAESKGHKLYYAKPGSNGLPDPNLSVYELYQYYNDEILWANGNNSYRIVGNDMEARTNPRDLLSNGFNNVGVYQESVDAFFMKNGLTIKDNNSGYREDGFDNLVNVCSSVKHNDKHIFYMYHDREPRFYAAVAYEGKSWHLPVPGKAEFGSYFSKGGGSDNTSQDHPKSGYLLYKFKNRQMLNQEGQVKTWARPWILFRLADFYLYYAEVCNEINPGDPKIIEYIDKIRDRAGIPGYRELAGNGIKNIIGDYEMQKLAIQRERKVELFAEGNYYFDIHRWMTCMDDNGEDQAKIRTGMDLNSSAARFNSSKIPTEFYNRIGAGSYYNRTVVENRVWDKSMLLYPVPYTEIQKSRLLVQNPLWN
jgi:hypothetical protein